MNKPALKFLLKLLISAVLIYIVFTRIDFTQLYNLFQSAKTGYLSLVLVLIIFFLLPKIYKWYYLARQIDDTVSFKDATLSYLAGLVLGVITPARTGEIARVMYLNLNDRLKGTGLVIIDRLFDIWVVLLFCILGSIKFLHYSVTIVLIVISVCFLLLLYFNKPMLKLLKYVIQYLPFKKKLESILDAFSVCSKSTSTVVLLSTLASYFVFCIQAYYFILCFQTIKFMSVLESFPLIALVNVLPVTIGGIGLRENTAIVILGKYSILPEVAASVSFMLFFIDIVIPGVIGLIVWTLLKRSSSQ